LIADEPTGDLDEETAEEIMQIFTSIAKKGTAVLMVTHDMGFATYGARSYRMASGQLFERSETQIKQEASAPVSPYCQRISSLRKTCAE
jgi:ABC-type lipoprotein export system ATPase subunit